MEDIQVGEYVKTKKGNIYKVEDIDEIFIYVDREVKYIEETNASVDYIKRDSILKHSFNIIDLIEVNDFVNGKRVFATDNRINDNGEKVILTENYDEWTDDGVIANKDIIEILTKEQYNSNCYRLEE